MIVAPRRRQYAPVCLAVTVCLAVPRTRRVKVRSHRRHQNHVTPPPLTLARVRRTTADTL